MIPYIASSDLAQAIALELDLPYEEALVEVEDTLAANAAPSPYRFAPRLSNLEK